MLSFEQAEAQLTPAQRKALAQAVLDNQPLPQDLTEAQRTFCMGLEVYREYECEADVMKYL